MHRLAREGPISAFEAYRLPPGSPFVRGLFVRTLNGAAADETGWTDTLGGPEDLAVLSAARAHADVVVVGAGTIRTGRMPPLCKVHRAAEPGTQPPQLVVVSGRLDLDWDLPVFAESARPPIVATSQAAAAARGSTVPITVLAAGQESVDLAVLLARLRDEHGLPRVLCEGGATLLNGFLDAGLVDELCLTLAPTVVGGAPEPPVRTRREFELTDAYAADSVLFLRYRMSS